MSLNSKQYCQDLKNVSNESEFLRMVNSAYSKRDEAVNDLMDIAKGSTKDNFYYPNLDYIDNFYGYYNLDLDCLCNITSTSVPISETRVFGQGKVGKASLIKVGIKDSKGNDYILKEIKGVNYPEFKYMSLRVMSVGDISASHFLNNPSIKYNSWKTDISSKNLGDSVITAYGDSFTIQTVIHTILNTVLNKQPNYVRQYDAFYCKRDGTFSGYNITELCNLGSLSDYIDLPQYTPSGQSLWNMITQVLTPLSILKSNKYGFVHADLKCRNVFVKGTLDNPVLKLADFDKSSIFFNGIRFYNGSGGGSLVAFLNNYKGYFVQTLEGKKYYKLGDGDTATNTIDQLAKNNSISKRIADSSYNDLISNMYKYIPSSTPFNKVDTAYIMNSWIPMLASHDVYTFWVSLMREPKIWKYYIENRYTQEPFINQFRKAWEHLWFKDELIDVENGINKDYLEYTSLLEKFNTMIETLKDIKSSDILNDLRAQNVLIEIDESIDKDFEKNLNYIVSGNVRRVSKNFKEYISKGKYKVNIEKIISTGEEMITKLEKLRSISEINAFLQNFKLKVDIDDIYNFLLNKRPEMLEDSPYNKRTLKITPIPAYSTEQYHICVDACKNGKCKTNSYSYTGWTGQKYLYTEHDC